MPRAYHRRSLLLGLALAACAAEPQPEAVPRVKLGADCAVLADAAVRAAGCDPALAELAASVRATPDEHSCREQARRLLAEAPSDARVHGVYEGTVDGPPPPLSADERKRLLALSLPGILRIHPDLPPGPGVPVTTVELGEHAISPRTDGSFLAHVAPGEHTLQVTHAGKQREFCVALEACAPVELTAHGDQLARHERLSPGACRQPGLTVAAGDAG